MFKRIMGGVAVLSLIFCLGCAESALIAGATGGAAGIGGAVYYLTSQPWFAKICYWVGDEGALVCMRDANATIDQDTIGACGLAISYLQTAEGLPAATVNAQLAQTIASLPATERGAIQEAAAILDEYLPPATSILEMSKKQLNDIVQFLTGWQDGTKTCLDNLPASIRARLKATAKIANLRAAHPALAKASPATGWFSPAAAKK
jgi:hypothetical protein